MGSEFVLLGGNLQWSIPGIEYIKTPQLLLNVFMNNP